MDDIRKSLNRLDDKFGGDYDYLLDQYINLKSRYEDVILHRAILITIMILGLIIFVLYELGVLDEVWILMNLVFWIGLFGYLFLSGIVATIKRSRQK